MLKLKEKNKGITLIALVITIIVLLILAAITIAALSGENGILKQAQRARLENKRATVKEIIKIAETDEYIEHRDESDRVILEATQKHLKNPKSPLYDQGKKVKVDENIYGENSGEIYFYVVVDDDIYKVTREDVEIIGQVEKEDVKLQEGEMEINQNPTIWTNDKVKITIVVNTDKIIDYAIKYKIHYKTVEELEAEKATGEGTEEVAQTNTEQANSEQATTEEWQTYTNEFEVDKNCIIYAKLEGINGETSVVTGNVMRIDKLNPKEFTPEITEVTTNSITVKANTTDADETNEYGCSEIERYYFSKNNGDSWEPTEGITITEQGKEVSYTFQNLTQSTDYPIKVKVVDKAKNEKESTNVITQKTKTVPKLQTGTEGGTGTQKGNVTFTYTPSANTKDNVKVKIEETTGESGYTLQYRTEKTDKAGEVKDWTNYTGEITLERNQNIYARLIDSTKQYGEYATGTILNIDKIEPKDFTPKASSTTNSITVTASTTDADKTADNACSGLTTSSAYRYKIDTGNWTDYTGESYTFSGLTQNTSHTITVEAKDNVGNVRTKTITQSTGSVPGLKNGSVTFTYNPSGNTKENVKVGITGNNTGYELQYKTSKTGQSGEVNDWTKYTGEITLTRNQEIYARVVDSTGQSATTWATGTLKNIDKLEPKDFTPKASSTTNSITVTASTTDADGTADYACSGLTTASAYRYKIDTGNWTGYTGGSYTFSGLTQNTSHTITVEAKDNVGNVRTKTITQSTGSVPGLKNGSVTFTYNPSGNTKENVKVGITGNNTGYELQYKTSKTGQSGEVSNWTKYTGEITLTRNQEIYARVVDSTGQSATTHATGTLVNIDKLQPKTFTPSTTSTANSITVTASTTDADKTTDYACSGLTTSSAYRYKIDSGNWTSYTGGSYTFNSLTQNTSHTITVEAKDNVGNTRQATITANTLAATLSLSSYSGTVVDGASQYITIYGSNYGNLSCSTGNSSVATAYISGTTLVVTGCNSYGTQNTTITVYGSAGVSTTYTITSHRHTGSSTSGGGCYGSKHTDNTYCGGTISWTKVGSHTCGLTMTYSSSIHDTSGNGVTGTYKDSAGHTTTHRWSGLTSSYDFQQADAAAKQWSCKCTQTVDDYAYKCGSCGKTYSTGGKCNAITSSHTYYTRNCGY